MKSKIWDAIHGPNQNNCKIYYVDVSSEGHFTGADHFEANSDNDLSWNFILGKQGNETPQTSENRVRALFVENISGPVLQMLGTKYNIEPFFFSSSLNWIPSRFQEEVKSTVGDHITITMTFLRSMPPHNAQQLGAISPYLQGGNTTIDDRPGHRTSLAKQMINIQAPLPLGKGGHLLVLDLLSIHLIRRKSGSVIISFHPNLDRPTTSASFLHKRIQFAGQSVYWQNIFQRSQDPTFVLLTYIWHALYSWDEAFERLYAHICDLETKVIDTTQMDLTEELHIIRAHHLHYSSLLEDFRKTVEFVCETANPALDDLPEADREWNSKIMARETTTILSEISRLEKGRKMQDRRLKNVMNLVFSSVNINDSKQMAKMTQAAVRDSAAMKQIAYLTMVFLPASFVATAFGMNISEIVPGTTESLEHYFETALPLTLASVWVIIAFQSKYVLGDEMPFWQRLGWPILMPLKRLEWGPWSKKQRGTQRP